MNAPGRLLAAGRSADVYEIDAGTVLRRRRSSPIDPHEPLAMELARRHGVPVPDVHRVDGHDMVLERLDGPDLLSRLAARPWRALRIASVLADLHRRLADVPPGDLRVIIDPAEAVVHGDLHPGNVLDTARGPVVIDWEGAGAGPRDADVATTWLLLSVAELDDVPLPTRPVAGLLRTALTRRFLAEAGRPRPETVRAVCDRRLADPNMRPGERERIRRFRSAHGGPDQPAPSEP